MPSEPKPYWGNKHRPFVRIRTDEEELRVLADAIVRGASIAHAQIADLRALIEAVHRHPKVKLRPPKDNDAISEATKVKPTLLVIHGGRVDTCDCSELDIRVTLTAATYFGEQASFAGATFGESATFADATFDEQASFDGATFGESATFAEATFGEQASFAGTTFRDEAIFAGVTFGDETNFYGATFGDWAIFFEATFGEHASFDGATFGESATFDQATFGERARFDGATFGEQASFAGATLGESATFDQATFGERADFAGATFGKQAHFARAIFGEQARFVETTFHDRASFIEATFGERARFAGAAFGERADFGGATFGERADFGGATFGEQARLFGASFGKRADFAFAIFGERADFAGASFGERADFAGASFGERAAFAGAAFGDEVRFDGATFGDEARFAPAIFGEQARFDEAIFGDEADFDGAIFGDAASFDRATFGERANFDSAKFGERARFVGATFGERARFEGAEFREQASFEEATFGERAWFHGAAFGERANFRRATFGDRASFIDCDLNHAAIKDVVFDRANLCLTRGILFDETRIAQVHMEGAAPDPWSTLRRLYTGPWFFVHLILLAIFFAPYVANVLALTAASKLQESMMQYTDAADEKVQTFRREHPISGRVAVDRTNLRGRLSEVETTFYISRDYLPAVWILIGGHKGWIVVVMALIVMFYNALRAVLTMQINALRDAEERSDVTPRLDEYYGICHPLNANQGNTWRAGIRTWLQGMWSKRLFAVPEWMHRRLPDKLQKRFSPDKPPSLIASLGLYRVHQLARLIMWIAIVATAWNSLEWVKETGLWI